jgi:ABC-type multidrug transport system ATPase subunit
LNDTSKIVILDEPSNGLDLNTRNNMTNYIKHIKSRGKTVLIISHDPYFKEISDSVLEFQENDNPKLLY